MNHRDAHLNMVESSRRLFGLDPGAELEVGDGWVFGAGSASHPVISNAAFRTEDRLDPDQLIERARAFFAPRGRGFAVWARTGTSEDGDLLDAAERAGLKNVYEMPEMVREGEPFADVAPDGVELRRVTSQEDAARYWKIAISSYANIGFPPEIFAFYEDNELLWSDGVAAFLAHLDGRPAGISMTIVSHGVAGIYWVGASEEARGKGLGRAVTAAAVNAGLEMGATSASLQASPMGESLYRQMGFETIYDYRLYLSSPPKPSAQPG